jgi:hypothetical protein
MHRNKLKVLGLALVAALALTAVMASAASAQFTSDKEHTIYAGSQKEGTNHVFTAGEGFGGIACETVNFSGTAVGTSNADQTITPTYSSCKDSFGRTVDPHHNSFDYTFNEKKGTVDLSGSMVLTVTDSGSTVCTVTISAQTGVNGISYTSLGGTKGMEVTSHSTNVKSTTEGGFFNCGISNGEHTSGTYDGIAEISGKDTSGKAVEISNH